MDELRTLRNATPFTPFSILMKNGGLIEVELPQRIAISPRGRVVSVFEGNHLRILEVDQVRRVQVEEGPATRVQG
jgi:hypothetical protein